MLSWITLLICVFIAIHLFIRLSGIYSYYSGSGMGPGCASEGDHVQTLLARSKASQRVCKSVEMKHFEPRCPNILSQTTLRDYIAVCVLRDTHVGENRPRIPSSVAVTSVLLGFAMAARIVTWLFV